MKRSQRLHRLKKIQRQRSHQLNQLLFSLRHRPKRSNLLHSALNLHLQLRSSRSNLLHSALNLHLQLSSSRSNLQQPRSRRSTHRLRLRILPSLSSIPPAIKNPNTLHSSTKLTLKPYQTRFQPPLKTGTAMFMPSPFDPPAISTTPKSSRPHRTQREATQSRTNVPPLPTTKSKSASRVNNVTLCPKPTAS